MDLAECGESAFARLNDGLVKLRDERELFGLETQEPFGFYAPTLKQNQRSVAFAAMFDSRRPTRRLNKEKIFGSRTNRLGNVGGVRPDIGRKIRCCVHC